MAVTVTQHIPLQQEELIFQQTSETTDFEEIKTFLDLLRDYKIPKSTVIKQKEVYLSSLRSDTSINLPPRFNNI